MKTLAIIPFLTLAAALPALAGSPDAPGERGEIVGRERAASEERTGAKNGWGMTVSGVARGDNPFETRSVGEYLGDEAAGPDPSNDQGQGND